MAQQTLLVRTTRSECEYDRATALRVYHLLRAELTSSRDDRGYREYPNMTDDDRIVSVYELLEGSVFGDVVFPDLANHDAGCELIERSEDD